MTACTMTERTTNPRVFSQYVNGCDRVDYEVAEVLAEGRTDFQEYLFFRSPLHGVCIVLDGDLQSTAADEGIYHEALVHPAMLAHPEPRTVLIMGGGEGATAREVLRHPMVEKVVMVDIDRRFVELCRELIPSWSEGVWEDPRLEVRYEDINRYINETDITFDVVVGDLVDVVQWDSPAGALYDESFYRRLHSVLASGAVLGSQAGALSATSFDGHRGIVNNLAKLFPSVRSYGMVVPGFYQNWGFVLAEDGDPVDPELFGQRAAERGIDFVATGADALTAAFRLPVWLREKTGIR